MLRAWAVGTLLGQVAIAAPLGAQSMPDATPRPALTTLSADSLRELFRLQLRASVRPGSGGPGQLQGAGAVAAAYAAQLHDSTLLRQLVRFERWSFRDRAAKVVADSLRHAGFELFPREGAAAALPLWRQSLRTARAIGDSSGIAATSGNLGAAFIAEGESDSADRYLNQSRRLAQRLGDSRALGNALGLLGSLARSRGNYLAARGYYERALTVRGRAGDDRGAAADENNLGLIAQELRDTAAARRFFQSALSRNRAARRLGPAGTNLANLANLAAGAGRGGAAARLYREAVGLHRSAGELRAAGLDLRAIGGLELGSGDYPAAITSFTEAVTLLDAAGTPADAIGARADLAEALAAVGDLGRAAAVVDSATASLRHTDPALEASLALLRGDLAHDADAADDARAAYARADSLYTAAGDAAGAAAGRQGLGMLLLRDGDYVAASHLLRGAARVQRAAGQQRAAAISDMLAGVADADGGSLDLGLAGIRRARAVLQRVGDAVGAAAAWSAAGDAQQAAGRFPAAEASYRAGLRRLGARRAPAVVSSLRWGLGHALYARGDTVGSIRELRLAVEAVESVATRMPMGERRTSLLGQASSLYAELALVQHRAGDDDAAFETSEQLRAHEMRELLSADRGPGAPMPVDAAVRPAAVSARLHPGEALLEYLVTDSTTILFVVTRAEIRGLTVPAGRAALRAAVDFARAAIARGATPSIAEPWAPPMRRLRRLLITPAESAGLLSGIHRLLIAPHAELHYLPFVALMSPGPAAHYLVERYEVGYVPSAAVWIELQTRVAPRDSSVLAIAPFPVALPGSREETRAIGRMFGPRAQTMTGAAATRQAFLREAPGRSIIHLATYGILNRRNPAFSFVAFAGEGDDARLTAADVMGLSLRAHLVVLSACETGLGSGASADVPAGDEWVGLVRAFLIAGADNVMASLWPIEDRSTSRIVPLLYAGLRGGDVVTALASAQRAALRDPVTAAPRHWAALVVVGAMQPAAPRP